MKYQYRIGNKEDIKQLIHVGYQSYGSFKDQLDKEHWQQLKSFLTDPQKYKELLDISRCFVCEKEGKIVGMAFFVSHGNPTKIFSPNSCYLRMVGVLPNECGKGIGRKLTQRCLNYAKETEEKVIALHTSEIMDAARHIYESMGFQKVKELPLHLGLRYWLYEKEI